LAHKPQKGSDAASHLSKQCTKDAVTATMQCHINAEDNDLDFLQNQGVGESLTQNVVN
jgi:hypothetical protein